MFCQTSMFLDFCPAKQQHEFRKCYSSQYCLLVMLEKWKNVVDKEKCFTALLSDLSKVFNCLSHELHA